MENAEKDFKELLELFNKHNVKYCIIGAFAVAFHAVSRYTKDLDILIDPSPENARHILAALRDFGFGSLGLTENDFTQKGMIIQLGMEPVRIDLINSLEGPDWNDIWKNLQKGHYGTEEVFFIGRAELIRNKESAGRPQDKVDVDLLKTSLPKNGKE